MFIDFETGGLLHITGTANIDWKPDNPHDPGALRMINICVDAVIDRPNAVSLRWEKQPSRALSLKLSARHIESEDITSFYFTSADGRSLEPYEPGQYLPIEVQIPGQPSLSKRSYSLSGSPEDLSHYRITVKRERKGVVSQFLHDHLHAGCQIVAQAPSGGFVIPDNDCPLVLVSAGVGLTPMVSMLHRVAKQKKQCWYIHGVRNGSGHALRDEVKKLVEQNDCLQQKTYFSRPQDGDELGRDYDVKGRITAQCLIKLNAGASAHYMLCGPMPFLAELRNGLEAAGVAVGNIHFETFGADNTAAV